MSDRQHKRVAIFDIEGTLIDCVPLVLESWREILAQAGHSFTAQDLQPFSGMDGEWMLEQLLPHESMESRKSLLEAQGAHYRDHFIRLATPFPGVRELFESLQASEIAIGIATTCQADELAIYDERLRILDLVQAVQCGDTVKHGKPDPALFIKCLKALQVSKLSRATAIGDTPYDAQAANAAGMTAAGVLTGGFSETSLLSAGCNHIFEDIRCIRSIWLPGEAYTH